MHAESFAQAGLFYIRHMIALLQHAHCPYHHICLTKQFSADVAWWRTFILMWNGVGIFPLMAQPTASDASGNWGCGAWSGTAWFQFQWPQGAAQTYCISGAGGCATCLYSMGQALAWTKCPVQVQ